MFVDPTASFKTRLGAEDLARHLGLYEESLTVYFIAAGQGTGPRSLKRREKSPTRRALRVLVLLLALLARTKGQDIVLA